MKIEGDTTHGTFQIIIADEDLDRLLLDQAEGIRDPFKESLVVNAEVDGESLSAEVTALACFRDTHRMALSLHRDPVNNHEIFVRVLKRGPVWIDGWATLLGEGDDEPEIWKDFAEECFRQI